MPAAAFNEGMKCSLRIAHVNALSLDRSAVTALASFAACPLPLLRQQPLLHTRDFTARRSCTTRVYTAPLTAWLHSQNQASKHHTAP